MTWTDGYISDARYPAFFYKEMQLPEARASLLAWLERRGGTVDDYVFSSRVDHNGHLSTS